MTGRSIFDVHLDSIGIILSGTADSPSAKHRTDQSGNRTQDSER